MHYWSNNFSMTHHACQWWPEQFDIIKQ